MLNKSFVVQFLSLYPLYSKVVHEISKQLRSYGFVILVFVFRVNILAVLGGGKTNKDAVKRMMGRVMKKSLSLKINWTGARGKVAFKSLHLKNVLHSKLKPKKIYKKKLHYT